MPTTHHRLLLRVMDYAAGCTHPGCLVRFVPGERRHISRELLDRGFPVHEVCPAHVAASTGEGPSC